MNLPKQNLYKITVEETRGPSNIRYTRNRIRGTIIKISTVVTYISHQNLHLVSYLDHYKPPKREGRFHRNYHPESQLTKQFHRSYRLTSDYFCRFILQIYKVLVYEVLSC
jgi:hypothetical protein